MFLYWVHLPEQKNIFNDGYVGIAKNFKQRMSAHKSCAKTGQKQILYQAIRKYGWNNIVKEIVLIADEKYCLETEKKLRPSEKIGWNIAIGGGEISGASLKGTKQSKDHLEKRKKALVGRISGMKGKKQTKQAIEKTMLYVRGIPKTEETKNKIGKANSKQIKINGIVYNSWKQASKETGIPSGSLSGLLKSKMANGKWRNYKVESVI